MDGENVLYEDEKFVVEFPDIDKSLKTWDGRSTGLSIKKVETIIDRRLPLLLEWVADMQKVRFSRKVRIENITVRKIKKRKRGEWELEMFFRVTADSSSGYYFIDNSGDVYPIFKKGKIDRPEKLEKIDREIYPALQRVYEIF